MFCNYYNNCACNQTDNTVTQNGTITQNNCGQYYHCHCRCYPQTNRNCGRWVYVPVYQRTMAWVYVGGNQTVGNGNVCQQNTNQTVGGTCLQNTTQTNNRCLTNGEIYYARQYGLY